MASMKVAFAGVMLALFLAACGASLETKAKEQEVLQGVSFVKRMINRTSTDPMAAMSLGSTAEMGGSVIHYITANLPEDAKFTCYLQGVAPKPYCVLIKEGEAAGEYIIEGYGEKLDKPLVVEKAVAMAPRRQ